MTFSSPVFLFAFLPVVLVAYHLVRALSLAVAPRVWPVARGMVLLVSSVAFYGWGEPRLAWLMLVSCGIDWVASLTIAGAWRGPARALDQGGPRTGAQRATLVAALGANLALLGFFKYYHFARACLDGWLGALGAGRSGLPELVELTLPLGISFYTFESMSYTIDVYRGHVAPTRNPLEFASFITMFPRLVAGPIVRFRDVMDQYAVDGVSRARFARGVRRFVAGLAKKVLIANTLAVPVDAIHSLPADSLTAPLAWLAVVGYALQIYFDFSGYSDMAIGLGQLLGFEFPENFRYPYAARSLRDFWRRWHISLSTWFRDYLYIPLGGDRGTPGRTAANLFLVFALCGLWHGAALPFLVWGLWHGAFLYVERGAFGLRVGKAWPPLAHAYTLAVVAIGWVPFRAQTLAHAGAFLAALADSGAGDPAIQPLALYLTPQVAVALAAGALLALPLGQARLLALDGAALALPGAPALRVALLAALFAASALALAAGTHNPFIYYRF